MADVSIGIVKVVVAAKGLAVADVGVGLAVVRNGRVGKDPMPPVAVDSAEHGAVTVTVTVMVVVSVGAARLL